VIRSKDAGEQESDGDFPPVLSKGCRGACFIAVLWVMVCHDRIQTTLLQLFAQENSEWLSIISVIIFEVVIVAEQKQKNW